MRAEWLILLVLSGCGLTTHVRPVPAGTLQVEGAIGGPIVDTIRAPLPDATVGVRYGLVPQVDVGLHADVAAPFGGFFQFDAEANWLAFDQQPLFPALSLNFRGYGFGNHLEVLGAGELGATLSRSLTPQWMLFGNMVVHLGVASPSGMALAAGTRLTAGPFGIQAELRWYALDPVVFNNQTFRLVPLFGLGAIGLVVGADYQIGFGAAPASAPTPAP